MALGLSVVVVDGGRDDLGDAVCAHAQVPALVVGGPVGSWVGFDAPTPVTYQSGRVPTRHADQHPRERPLQRPGREAAAPMPDSRAAANVIDHSNVTS